MHWARLTLNRTGMLASSTTIPVGHAAYVQTHRRARVERQTNASVEQSVFPFGSYLSPLFPATQCVSVFYLVLVSDFQLFMHFINNPLNSPSCDRIEHYRDE
jgi:hypothetical protein